MLPELPANTIPRLMVEGLLLRGQLACARDENARLRREICALRLANRPAESREKPAFDWRLVLENPDLGWAPDIIDEAKALRDAENRKAVRR